MFISKTFPIQLMVFILVHGETFLATLSLIVRAICLYKVVDSTYLVQNLSKQLRYSMICMFKGLLVFEGLSCFSFSLMFTHVSKVLFIF